MNNFAFSELAGMSKSFEEKDCFNIFWKIKNFSYCWTTVRSPEFTRYGDQYWLELDPKYLNCKVSFLHSDRERYFYGHISFLTCDGSKEESSDPDRIHGPISFSSSIDIIFGVRRDAFLPKDTLTIRCRLTKDYQPPLGKVHIRSRIGVKRKCFLWTMNNFSLKHVAQKLSVENSDLYGKIHLNLKTRGGMNSDEQICIDVSRKGGESFYSVLKVSVLDIDGKAVNCVCDEFSFEKEDREQFWRFPPVMRTSKLFARKDVLLPKSTLSLNCDFALILGKVTNETTICSYFEDVLPLLKGSEDPSMCFEDGRFPKSVTDLKTDLKTILDNRILCDVNLQMGSDVIQVHKTILSARSPVFKAMFTKDMKETINKTVVIEDLDADTIRRLLLYMYTDTIHDYKWENVLNLYFAADKYEVLSLKEKCSSFLKENLSFSNVCEILVLADLHQDQGLLSTVHDFISKYNSEVFASEAWSELEKNKSSLAVKTLREVCSKK